MASSPAESPPDLLAGEDLPQEPKQERSRQARAALLDAALALFAEHGFEATSVEDIATRAGVAVGGFYLHFRSKRQVLLVLMDRLLTELAALDLSAASQAPPQMVIAGLVHVGLRVDWAYIGAYRAWHEVMLRDPELRELHRRIEAWSLSRLRLLSEMLAAHPAARDDIDVETFSWVVNQLFWRLTEAEVADRDAVEKTVAKMLTHMLFKDAP
jgi:AcrR family transcriptional regulator